MMRWIIGVFFVACLLQKAIPAYGQEPVGCETLAISLKLKDGETLCLTDTGKTGEVTITTQILGYSESSWGTAILYEIAHTGDLPQETIYDKANFLLSKNAKIDSKAVTVGSYQVLRFWDPEGDNPGIPCDGAVFVRSISAYQKIYGSYCADGSKTPKPISNSTLATLFDAIQTRF